MPEFDIKKCDILILSADFGTGHHQVSVAIKRLVNQKQPSLKVGIYNYFEYIYPPVFSIASSHVLRRRVCRAGGRRRKRERRSFGASATK